MNGTVAFPIFKLQFYKEQLCIGSFHTSYRLFANISFASNLCTVTYPCFVLCLTPVFVFKYRSTSSQTIICPSTIFTSKSKSVFTCFSNSRRERHGFLPFGSLSVGYNGSVVKTKIWYFYNELICWRVTWKMCEASSGFLYYAAALAASRSITG